MSIDEIIVGFFLFFYYSSEVWPTEKTFGYEDIGAEEEFNFMSEVKGYELFNLLVAKDVSFYDKLKTVKSDAFYIYAWSILGNLNSAVLTLDKDDWKYKSSKAILDSPNYDKLSKAFLEINRDTSGWFKEHIFNYYIGEYMNESVPVLTRVRQRRVD